ncbi:hypothetical protein [Arcobacter sp. FWKO B]|uniref:hypothetical protein n=1 Tax=Arcobacter sp. FWKO B TaxID=2593672 RepID=UPI0018A3653F|nr:hypothetical protein [Arcobacter sp. FWKO B]QOG11349.1 hypothetical protein FWKOB_00965 [Arcobacter sp. FWKO B]
MAEGSKELDVWQKALEAKLNELQSCQNSKNVDSCFKCNLTLECILRKEYVKAVYESMSKGSMGGFEF